LQELYEQKLVTPLEDVNSIKENQKVLREKTEKLADIRTQKKDQYDKYVEECTKGRDIKAQAFKDLNTLVSTLKADCEIQINEAKEKGMKDEEDLKEQHKKEIEKLENQKRKLEQEVQKVKTDNEKEEKLLRDAFKKVSGLYQNYMGDYDKEVKAQTVDNFKAQAMYEDIYADL
jgi:hypothetical protein